MTDDPFGQPGPRESLRTPEVRNGRYRLFSPADGRQVTWSRVSTFAKAIADPYHLERWKLRRVVEGIGLRADLRDLACAVKPDEPGGREQLQEIATKAMSAAKSDEGANRGTTLHALIEDLDRGLPVNYPDERWRADVESYDREMAAFGLVSVPELIERYVVCPELELCGRLDRVLGEVDAPADRPFRIGDAKSADKIEYGWLEIAIQLAIYAHASHYWDPEKDDWVPMPPMDHKVGVVMHTRIGSGQTLIRPIDIETGWEAAHVARQVRKLRSGSKNLELSADALGGSHAAQQAWSRRIAQATRLTELAAIWDAATARGEWTNELHRAGLDRAAAIKAGR